MVGYLSLETIGREAWLLLSKMASLAEQIQSLSRPEPANFDPEEDDFDTTRATLVRKDEGEELDVKKVVSSALRRKNDALLADEDKKYSGRRISRAEIAKMRGDFQDSDHSVDDEEEEESDRESLDDESDDDGNRMEEENNHSKCSDDDDDNNGDDDNDTEKDSDGGDNNLSNMLDEDDGDDNDDGNDDDNIGGVNSFTASRMEDEIEKGIAVKQQQKLWDSLLEYRIRIQKAMVLSNKLPQYENCQEFTDTSNSNLQTVQKQGRKTLADLLHKLLTVQEKLLEKNPETNSILYPGMENGNGKEISNDEEILSDSEKEDDEKEEEEVRKNVMGSSLKLPLKRKRHMTQQEFSECIAKRHTAFQSYRDSVISKWSEKTRLASGKLSSKSFSAFDRSALTQIKQILSDKPRLIKRTQLKRSSYRILGKPQKMVSLEPNAEEQADLHLKDYDTEIFDDDDFYHQLLRELIERQTMTSTKDPIEMGRQWLELQKLRRKIKKRIDTKASKGRKLRYNIHSKLVSYMPAIDKGTMADSSRNELFSSLFGQSGQTQSTASDVDVLR